MSDFKKRIYINLGVITGIIAIFVAFSILLRLNIEKENSLIMKIKNDKNKIAQSSENLALLIKDETEARPYLDKVKNLVPQKGDLVNLKRDMNDLARQNNTSLSFNFGSESAGELNTGLGAVNFNAQADGTIDNLLGFIRELEDKYFALKINSLDINRLSGPLMRIVFNGQMFYVAQ